MKPFTILSLAACLPLGSVESFQIAPPRTVGVTKKIGAITHAAAAVRPRSSASSSSSLSLSLEEIQQQFTEITESFAQAKKRQDEAREKADLIREERSGVVSETEMAIDRLKRDLSEEITDLGDQVEGAQDDLRKTMSKTKSEISNMRGEVHEREEILYSEISDLESRLAALRKEAKNAAKERDTVKNSLKKDERNIRASSRKELENVKRTASQEKKELTRESRALENRIQQAAVELIPSMNELEEVKREQDTSKISALKDALMKMKRKMLPQVEELKENRKANEMFFDQSLNDVKRDEKDDLDLAKTIYEGEISNEDRALENATSYYDLQLEAKEKELLRNIELSAKPVESAGVGAIEEARKNIVALLQETNKAVSKQQDDGVNAVKNAVESHSAIEEQYDAEYEKGLQNLKEQDARGKRQLQKEDKKRENRKGQLQREMEELPRKLSLKMQDEKAAAEQGYKILKQTKTTELADIVSRNKRAINETQTTRSNLIETQYQLKRLEETSQWNQQTLSELEEERTSFRKQVRRTMSVAISRITRRGS
mmetsp:Transcript_20926/g.38386  ORF Transcript_20926/g.38386 Transcript_20926/m.38386 type:complete len:546 (-) Transcript_20926:364-2001(-)